jgi:hypothetical protein
MDDRALWKLNSEAWTTLESMYTPGIQTLIEQSGLDGRGWGLLLASLTFEPEPATPAHLMVRNPYTSADLYLARLRMCAGKGYLEENTAGEFRLTSAGRSGVEQFISQARKAMAELDPLLPYESQALVLFYKELVDSCLKNPPPPQTWSISLSYKLMPAEDPALPFIEQGMSCLSAYRDDAHLAAWQGTGLSATCMDMMTVLWRKEAGSFDEVIQKLAFRGYADQVYEKALDELDKLNYIQGSKGELVLSPEGTAFREQIEQDTDRYFFTPWSCLSNKDRIAMGQYLLEMIEDLKETAVNNN